jgi:hypothetical protein
MTNIVAARFVGVPALVAAAVARFEISLHLLVGHPEANELLTAHAVTADGEFWFAPMTGAPRSDHT